MEMVSTSEQIAAPPVEATHARQAAVSGGRQVLNAADRFMQVAHDTLRAHGHCGFQCQTHVWFSGRVDAAALRAAIERLNRAFPVVTSRLVVPEDRRQAPYWAYRPGATAELREQALEAVDAAGVWRYAESLYQATYDLAARDPLTFHLLHLADGRDVLLLQFSHSLMDGKAPEFVLRELDRLCVEPGEAPQRGRAAPAAEAGGGNGEAGGDEMLTHLLKFPRLRRVRAALRVLGEQIRLPVHSATLVPPDARELTFEPFRILVRTIAEERTARITERVRRLCGFANLSPAVLAAIFRTVRRMTTHRVKPRTAFKTDVPLNLRPPGRAEPIFRNFMTFVQMSAQAREMDDGDELVRLLSARMRDQLRRGIDLGSLQMMQTMSPFTRLLGVHLLERSRKHPLTLGFGFLGPALPGLERLCGVDVDWLYSLNIAASPPGITVQVNQFRGRLNLVLTYVGKTVPDERAEAFLASVEAELLGGS